MFELPRSCPLRRLWRGAFFITAFAALIATPAAGATERLTLLLRWDHQFQFAGYYAAQWKGFYAEEGLEVTIRTPFRGESEIADSVAEVVSGRADFAIGGADILVARDKGAPVVTVATIFHESAAEYYIRRDSGYSSLADIAGLRVARRLDDLLDIEFQSLLLAEGIDPDTIEPSASYGGEDHLADASLDLIPGYSFVTPVILDEKGVDYVRLRPRDYGVYFYGDSLFTREALIRHNEKTVSKFVAASLRGWQYALDHPVEIADLIAERLERRFPVADPVAFNRAQIDGVLRAALYPQVEPGHINPGRWQHMHDWLERAGLIANPVDLDHFIYDPAKRNAERQRMLIELLIALIFAAAVLGTLSWIWLLRRAVRAKTAELELSQQHLSNAQKLATLGQLTATVSHELRNPLGVIRNALSLLAAKVDSTDGIVKRALERADRNIARCDRIVGELLDFTRTPELALEPIELDPWLSTVLDELTPPPGIAVIRNFAAPGVKVCIDSDRLRRAIINIQDNAWQAMEDGTGHSLTVKTWISGDRACVELSDTGTGMDAETAGKVFEPLFSTKSFGIGLGLPTVQQIMRGHSGGVDIDSAPGHGTTVKLWLPIHRNLAE